MRQLHAAAKRHKQARQAYRITRAVIDRVKASLLHTELRIGLYHSPLFQQVYDLSPSS